MSLTSSEGALTTGLWIVGLPSFPTEIMQQKFRL